MIVSHKSIAMLLLSRQVVVFSIWEEASWGLTSLLPPPNLLPRNAFSDYKVIFLETVIITNLCSFALWIAGTHPKYLLGTPSATLLAWPLLWWASWGTSAKQCCFFSSHKCSISSTHCLNSSMSFLVPAIGCQGNVLEWPIMVPEMVVFVSNSSWETRTGVGWYSF